MTDNNNNNNSNSKNSSNSNESNSSTNRQSASPARTIDSHDSTTGSLDTIVDRSLNREEMLQKKIEQSTNTTNAQHQHDSLTNSQISMLQQQSSSEDEVQHKQQPAQQQHFDAQNHIYSSPVYDQKPPLKLTAATLVATVAADAKHVDDLKKPKLITHEEFQKQLQEAVASRANTIDSRISKKQRFPPELIKIKDGDGSTSSLTSSKSKRSRKSLPSSACCSAFPLQIVLGSLQLVLAISLVALGSLLIVREAALSTAGCGIWTGLIAAVTGSLGVVSMRKTQTAFLALSLVCIATSTLALAISGVGLSRDLNRMEEEFELMNSNSEVSAACGLIFTLFLHFVVSIVSVYRCALQICSSSQSSDLSDIIIKSNSIGLPLDQEKVDQYIKAMSVSGSDKVKNEKLAAMWMYAAQMGTLPPQTTKATSNGRRIMLIPASAGNNTLHATPPPATGMMLPPPLIVPTAMSYRGMPVPYVRPSSLLYAHPNSSLNGTYRTQRSTKSADIHSQRRRRRAGQMLRSGKMDANRRQRRKSEADIIDGEAFQYTGLDRAIADSFLARQEQSNAGSQIDYSSSSSAASGTYGKSSHSSKAKIVCRDVVM